MSVLYSLLRNGARWLFLAALIYAPWAYGCTTAATLRGLNWILAVALGCWVLAEVIGFWLSVIGRGKPRIRGQRTEGREQTSELGSQRSRRHPDNQEPITINSTTVPWALIVPSVLLLLLGWWMAINARWIYDSDFFLFVARPTLIGAGPGSVDFSISVAWMIRGTLMIGAMLSAAQLCRDPVWILRLWWTIAIAGGSIALLGLIEKATGAPMIFWEKAEIPRITFFATYYAHGNAGAYLNLVFPISATLALRGFLRKGSPLARAIVLVICVLVMVAIVSNTSRGGQAVGVILLLGLVVCLRDLLFLRIRRIEVKTLVVAVAVIGFALVAIAGVSQLDRSLGRWEQLESKVSGDSRWLATRAAIGAIGDAGLVGFGPGTFRVVFPYYTNDLGSRVGGVWRFLHQDYLQTLIEWGWIGSIGWAFLFFGSIWMGTATLRGNHELSGRQRLVLTGSVLALGGVALHALVDFPLQIASLQLYVATYVGICAGSASWGAAN